MEIIVFRNIINQYYRDIDRMGPKPKIQPKPVILGKAKKKLQTHKLAPHINEGKIMVDTAKRSWKIGKSIGRGGFGEIYTATNDPTQPVRSDAPYVAKIEPKANGPLFTERAFYTSAAKQENIDEWKRKNSMKFLGMPPYVASGSCEHGGEELRFMVMHRYGTDIHKLFEQNGRRLPYKTVLNLGIKIMNVVEYIHSQGYIHGDIKGSNLLLGIRKGEENEVYLVDYGLAVKYIKDGVMRRTEQDSRFAHNGTIEFASRDAHQGKSSRRSDLEILGYNMVQWLAGTLPWEGKSLSDEQVAASKEQHMKNISSLLDHLPSDIPKGAIKKYLEHVESLKLEQEPDYDRCRKIFRYGLKEAGLPDDGKLEFTGKDKLKKLKGGAKLEVENVPEKRKTTPRTVKLTRKPCAPKNVNRPSPSSDSVSSDSDSALVTPAKRRRPMVRDSSADSVDSSSEPTPNSTSALMSPAVGNPTPAMLAVMALKKKFAGEGKPKSVKKASRNTSSTDSSTVDPSEILTPAMQEVIERRKEKATKPTQRIKKQQPAVNTDESLPDLEVTDILPSLSHRRSKGPPRRPPSKAPGKKVIVSKRSPIVPRKNSAHRSPKVVARSSPRFNVSMATQTSPGIFATPAVARKRNYRTVSNTLGAENSPDIF